MHYKENKPIFAVHADHQRQRDSLKRRENVYRQLHNDAHV